MQLVVAAVTHRGLASDGSLLNGPLNCSNASKGSHEPHRLPSRKREYAYQSEATVQGRS
jgi:hypothetical protein